MARRQLSRGSVGTGVALGLGAAAFVGLALGLVGFRASPAAGTDELYAYCPPSGHDGHPGGLDGQHDAGPIGGDPACGGLGDHNLAGGGGSGGGANMPHPGTGEILHACTDIASTGFLGWGHTRVAASSPKFRTLPSSYMHLRWGIRQISYLEFKVGRVYVVNGGRPSRSFSDPGTGVYPADLYFKETLTLNAGEYTLTDTRGGQTVYGSTGRFLRYQGPAGSQTERTATWGLVGGVSKITELVTSFNDGVATTWESWLYDYFGSGTHQGSLERVTLRRKVGSGAWDDTHVVRKAEYTYYDGSTAHGLLGDIELVEIKDKAGAVLETKYYRHTSTGLPKLAVPARGYDRMFAALGSLANIRSATDATIKTYAFFFAAYDGTDRVTERDVKGDDG